MLSVKSLRLLSVQLSFSNATAVIISVCITFALSYLVGKLIARLQLQQNLTNALNLSFVKIMPKWV